jgi:LysM repeat protein
VNFTNPSTRLAFFFFMAGVWAPATTLRAQSDQPASVTIQYIEHYKDIAESEMIRTGVPAAISLAQGILESQSGQGWLVEHSHNHFGVKCKSDWTGPTISYDDDRKNECFRSYLTDDSSWRDHSDFLMNNPRYAFLFNLDPSDYKAWATGLKSAGYATDRRYADRLIQTIERYHLEQYTDKVVAMGKGQPQRDFATMLDRKIEADRRARGIQPTEPAATSTPAVAQQNTSGYPRGVFRINGKRVVYLRAGTQLISVAETYHVRLSRLVSYNELQGDVLKQDQLVYLQKKATRGASPVHQVTAGETPGTVAQKEGIQLKWLRRFNRLSKDQQLRAGTNLYLEGYAPSGESGVSQSAPEAKKGFFARLFSRRSAAAPVARSQSAGTTTAARPLAVYPPQSADTASEAQVSLSSGSTPQTARPAADEATQTATYQVEKGDTLYGISRKYNVPVASLQKWNGIEGNNIRVGQKLIIQANH